MIAVLAFLSGILVVGYAVAGLFFLRFWRESRDRLFGWFAGAFFVLCLQRLLLATVTVESPLLYVVRLIAFSFIIIAIVEKNRAARSGTGPAE